MIKKKLLIYPSIFLLLGSTLLASPPPVPSAGIVERQLEKEYEARPLEADKQIPAIQIDIPEEKLDFPDGEKVFISQVVFTGNESISSRKLEKLIQTKLNRELSLQDIYNLCLIIDQHYAEEGYFLARSYPPPQTIEDGTLTIEVLEGKLGNIEIVGNKHYSSAFIRSYFTSLQNKPLQYEQFLRALVLLNENSDLMVGSVFEKGKEFGTADVILRVDDKRPIHLYLNGNNYGRNLTTNARVGGRLDWGNLITYGDTLSVAEVVGFPIEALYFTDATYTIPLNRKGTFLELAYLFSRYKIEELRELHLKARSDIGTIKASHALLRRRFLSVDLFAYFDYKQIKDFELGHRQAFDKLRVLTVGSIIDHFSPNLGRDYLNMRFAAGIPNFLNGLKPVDSESSRKGGGGRFFIFNADYDHLQHIYKDAFLSFHFSGQYSPNKLTLPEVMYIGGADTVRGYPLAVALGDSGYYGNLEISFPIPGLANKKFFRSNKFWKEIIQFDVFLDHGGVFLQSIRNTFLTGTGLGVKINGPYTLTFSLDVGFPLNHKNLVDRSAFVYIKLTGQPF